MLILGGLVPKQADARLPAPIELHGQADDGTGLEENEHGYCKHDADAEQHEQDAAEDSIQASIPRTSRKQASGRERPLRRPANGRTAMGSVEPRRCEASTQEL